MARSVAGNGVRAVVTFTDRLKNPATPDGDVKFTVYGQDKKTILFESTPEQVEALGEGTYGFRFTPQIVERIYVAAKADVNGEPQREVISHDVIFATR